MTVGPDNRVKKVLVQTGQRGGGWVELAKGPPVGTRVVASAAAFLLDGDLIKPQEISAVSMAAMPASTPAPAPVRAAMRAVVTANKALAGK